MSRAASPSYANVTSYTGCDADYDRPFVGSVDNSTAVVLDNCHWTQNVAGYTQGSEDDGWGTWTNGTGAVTDLSSLNMGSAFNSGNPPTLKCEATPYNFDVESGEAGGGSTSKTVHLGNGGAYSDLASALTAAGAGGTIIVDGTVTISEDLTSYDDLTIERGSATGALFEVTGGTVTLTSMTISGEGSGTLFEVSGGNLRLRGNVTLTDCDTAVDVQSGGTVTVNKTSISADEFSIKVAGSTSTFILEDYGGTSINAPVYLGSGAKITLNSSLASWTKSLDVTSADTASGTTIATCASATIASESAAKITVNGGAAKNVLRNIVIA